MSKYKVRKVEVNPPVVETQDLPRQLVETTGTSEDYVPDGFSGHDGVVAEFVKPTTNRGRHLDNVIARVEVETVRVKPIDDLTAPPAPTTLELCTPVDAPDFPTVPLASASTEQIIAELKDRGYYGVQLHS